MAGLLGDGLADLQQLAPRLRDFAPTDADWRRAETRALEVRDQVEALLRSPEGVQELRASALLPVMKQLVPPVTRDEVAELRVADFVLGIMFERPYATFATVYRGYGTEYGKELSEEARKSANNIKSSFIYGEILFFPFAEALRWVAPSLPEHAIFYDLGSGTGKAVIAASLLHPFDQAIGIELLEPLVACAEKRKAVLERLLGNQAHPDIDFITGSLLTAKWQDGDLVFCHGTCFNDQEWSQISLSAESMKQGAFFLSTSHVLQTAMFEVVKTIQFKMSWGTATLYIHRRRKIGKWAAQMLRGGRATRTDLLSGKATTSSSKADETRQ